MPCQPSFSFFLFSGMSGGWRRTDKHTEEKWQWSCTADVMKMPLPRVPLDFLGPGQWLVSGTESRGQSGTDVLVQKEAEETRHDDYDVRRVPRMRLRLALKTENKRRITETLDLSVVTLDFAVLLENVMFDSGNEQSAFHRGNQLKATVQVLSLRQNSSKLEHQHARPSLSFWDSNSLRQKSLVLCGQNTRRWCLQNTSLFFATVPCAVCKTR